MISAVFGRAVRTGTSQWTGLAAYGSDDPVAHGYTYVATGSVSLTGVPSQFFRVKAVRP